MNGRFIATQLCLVVTILSVFSTAGCSRKVDYAPKSSSTTSAKSPSESPDKTKSTKPDTDLAVVTKDSPKPAATEPAVKEPDLIAYDEFDGVNRGGWKEAGLGEWGSVAEERDGKLIVSGDVDEFRALAKPIKEGTVWYAITMKMETPVSGMASIDGSPGPPKRFSKLGFSAIDKPFTAQGFWMNTDRGTKVDNTEMQTFLTRLNFNSHTVEGYAARDQGLVLVDAEGMVFNRPRFKLPGGFDANQFSHLSLRKSGPEKLVVERIAIARTPKAALFPQIPAIARKPNEVEPEPTPSSTEQPATDEPTKEGEPGATPQPETKLDEPKKADAEPAAPRTSPEPSAEAPKE